MLSQRLARAMGGQVVMESRAGEGSCFTVRLPVKPQPAAEGEGVDDGLEAGPDRPAPGGSL